MSWSPCRPAASRGASARRRRTAATAAPDGWPAAGARSSTPIAAEHLEQRTFVGRARARRLEPDGPPSVGTRIAVDHGRTCGCSIGPLTRRPSPSSVGRDPGLRAGSPRRGRARSVAPVGISGSLPPPKSVPKTPRMMSWPSRDVTTLPPVRIAVVDRPLLGLGGVARRPSPAALRSRSAAFWAAAISFAWRAISRCCWAGVIVFSPVAVVGSHPGRASRPRPQPARGRARRRDPRGDPLVGAVAIDRRAVLRLRTGWSRSVPWNWTASIGAISESGASSRVGGERRRHAPRRQDGDQRLAGPERGDGLLDVVELGRREGPGRLAQGVGVVGREGAQRVLDAVAELGEDRRRARRSAPGSRSRRRRPSSG